MAAAATAAPSTGAEQATAATGAESSTGAQAAQPSYDYSTMGRQPGSASQDAGQAPALGQPAGGQQQGAQPEKAGQQAEKQPAEAAAAGTEGQQDDEHLPFSEHPRFKELIAERKQFKADADAFREVVASPDEARFLVERVTQLEPVEQNHRALQARFGENPVDLAREWQAKLPEAWDKVLDAMRPGIVADLADEFRRAGNSEVADALEQARQGYARRGSQQQPAQNDALARREQEISRREQALQQQTVSGFENRLQSDLGEKMRGSFKSLTEGFVFPSDAVKNRVFDAARDMVVEALEADAVWGRRLGELLRGDMSDAHSKRVVDANYQRALAGGLWERSVAKAIEEFGVTKKAVEAANGNAAKVKAATDSRKEPAAAGAAAAAHTAKTPAERKALRDQIIAEGKDPYTDPRMYGLQR